MIRFTSAVKRLILICVLCLGVLLMTTGRSRRQFYPCDTWEGERKGYAFKLGERGQGYYVLLPPREMA